MAYQKLQVGRATDMDDKQSDVEDTVNLDNEILTGRCAAGTTGTTIVDTANTFIDVNGNNLVNVGDLVVNTTSTPKASRITSVVSDTTIEVQTTGLFAATNDYRVLSQSDEPAVLYIGDVTAGASLKVRSAGGDDATFVNVVQGTFLPVQVKRIYATGTTASKIIALF